MLKYINNKLRGIVSKNDAELNNCDNNNTQSFSLENKTYMCKCISVYDGDTITVALRPFKSEGIFKFSVRLAGIDTPEIRTKNLDEKKMGLEVRDILREKILNKIIKIECGKFDKYGRLLGTIYADGENINNWIITQNYGYEYHGKTKKVFSAIPEL